MPGDKILMFLGVEDVFGFPDVFALGIPGVVSLGVPVVVCLRVTSKVSIWVTGKVFFCGSCGSMFTIIT